MKVAPLIHTRTFHCDFNASFAVKPAFFLEEDVQWARKFVLEATKSIDRFQGHRWLVVDSKEYRLIGIVAFNKHIFERCDVNNPDNQNIPELFFDDKGRPVYSFIGMVVKREDFLNCQIGELSFDIFGKIYAEYIPNIWQKRLSETLLSSVMELPSVSFSMNDAIQPVRIGQKHLYESNVEIDSRLFAININSPFEPGKSFCSNISDYATVKNSIFSHITTSGNTIIRCKRDNPSECANNFVDINKPRRFERIDLVIDDIIASYSNLIIENAQGEKEFTLSIVTGDNGAFKLERKILNVQNGHTWSLDKFEFTR